MSIRVVLDFDGVMCDALTECAAATLIGGRTTPGAAPSLDEALSGLTPAYLARFASVRPFSRTLTDFMVTNTLTEAMTTRTEFIAARDRAGADVLQAQASAAQRARDRWRRDETVAWLGLHTLYPGIAQLLTRQAGHIAVVSNKDADSIAEILSHQGLRGTVTTIVGECPDKPAAVRALFEGNRLTFVDDNADNAIAVSSVPGVDSRWATWGYHSVEDHTRVAGSSVRPIHLSDLPGLDQAA